MILTIGAILLFGVFLKTSNQLMIGNNQIAATNEYYISALSVGQSVIDEAKTKFFDEKTVLGPVFTADTLTAVNALGREGGAEAVPNPDTLRSGAFRSMTKFDDIDDYNGYRRLVNTTRAEGYNVLVSVNYASETNPEASSASKTFCKRMTVKVWSKYIPDTLKFSYAFAY
jgi:hypothetical protein